MSTPAIASPDSSVLPTVSGQRQEASAQRTEAKSPWSVAGSVAVKRSKVASACLLGGGGG